MPDGLQEEIRPGSKLKASVWEALRRIALRWSNFSVAPPLYMQSGPSGVLIGANIPEGELWAKITSGSNPYSWQEVVPAANGAWTTGARQGTTAYEVNGNTTITSGTYVRLDLSRGPKAATFIFSQCSGGS